MSQTARNALIVVAIAAAVWALPGGGDSAAAVQGLISLGISAAFVFIFARLYRERRMDLEGLGEPWRAILYGAVAVAVFAMAARARLFDTGAGVLVWVALVGGASYALVLTWRHYRSY